MAYNDIFASNGITNIQASKDAMQRLAEKIKANEKKQDLIDGLKKSQEEWIWVEGYKGTDANMACRGYQYEFGKVHYMPTDAEIKDCESGFHLCAKLADVFRYYEVGEGRRYFKVKALVKKKDYEEYGHECIYRGWMNLAMPGTRDKLVASAIEFISELDAHEVLTARGTDTCGWTDEDKKLAMSDGIKSAANNVKVRELTALGYSTPLAHYLTNRGLYDRAVTIGSQSDLSMDVKVLFIMSGK